MGRSTVYGWSLGWLSCLLFCAVAQGASIRSVPAERVYVPKGFDSNDDAQVVVAGYLPDLCYKSQRSEARVENGEVRISLLALYDSSSLCADVVVPFLEPVSLGMLPAGNHPIAVNVKQPSEMRGTLKVEATHAPAPPSDAHVYANVTRVNYKNGALTLLGTNPTDCFESDRVELISNGVDTYSVLPILKQVKQDCPRRDTPFAISATVPSELAMENLLLHVRIMNGKSFNALIDNRREEPRD